jgi:hypothetical protein
MSQLCVLGGFFIAFGSLAALAGPPPNPSDKPPSLSAGSSHTGGSVFSVNFITNSLQALRDLRKAPSHDHAGTLVENPIDLTKIRPFSSLGRLNPTAALLLKINLQIGFPRLNKLFVIFDVHSMIDLLNKLPDCDQTLYFAVFTGNRHWTPVIVLTRRIFILESLGMEKSKVGRNSITQIAAVFSKVSHFSDLPIFCTKSARQYDNTSCGTDCFYVFRLMEKHYHVLGQELGVLADLSQRENCHFFAKQEEIIDKEAEDLLDPNTETVKIFKLPLTPSQITKITQNSKKIGDDIAKEMEDLGVSSKLSKRPSPRLSQTWSSQKSMFENEEGESLANFIVRKSSTQIQQSDAQTETQSQMSSECTPSESQLTPRPNGRLTNLTLQNKQVTFKNICTGILELLDSSELIAKHFYQGCGFDVVFNTSYENLTNSQKSCVFAFFEAIQKFDADVYDMTGKDPLPAHYFRLSESPRSLR